MLALEGTTEDFASLSIKDLLKARDLYHFQLINKANVVGTAVGRYLIRKDERGGRRQREPRTFENSEVRPESWPCILVLIDNWVDEDQFGGGKGRLRPYEIVPNALYLPDGRKVPVCVVTVRRAAPAPMALPTWIWPKNLLGAGFPIVVDQQGKERRASIGCLVTDGHTLYALTSRHVCGTEGERIDTWVRSRRVTIGHTSNRQVTRLPFSECYPEYPARRTFVNLDIGLCQVEDAGCWTPRVYGLAPAGDIADLNEANIRLRLIDARVVAHGAASGPLEGRIKALFYRYKSVAGFDYVSDFLIEPVNGEGTRPGDSGTVWHLVPSDPGELLRPIAIEWGGQAFAAHGLSQLRFALATSLSSACKQLDVDLVRGDDTGVLPYWGQTGHYDIATFACREVQSVRLKKLMQANLERISFAENSLDAKVIAAAIKNAKETADFVPLADVPDIVWKNLPWRVKGGRDTKPAPHGSTGPEHPNHFADIDETGPRGKTLRQLCLDDDSNIDPKVWRDFYDAAGHVTPESRGLLPFRVWQHFGAMVSALRANDIPRFVAAAGTVSHYVGDACQPLHGSIFSDGFKDQKVPVEHHRRETGEEYTSDSNVGAGVHSAYETKMVDKHSGEIVEGVAGKIDQMPEAFDDILDGRGAAKATIQLMDRAATRLPPTQIVQTFIDAGGKPNNAAYDALWDRWGEQTIMTLADGARVLAWIWDSAWRLGGGEALDSGEEVPAQDLLRLYTEDPTFVPSRYLDNIDAELADEDTRRARPPARTPARGRRRSRRGEDPG